MDSLLPCPSCLSDVDVIEVNHRSLYKPENYFFVHCRHCGQGTAKAYPSQSTLKAVWNALALESQSTEAQASAK